MGNGIRLGNQVINQFGAPSINENTTANRPTFGQTGRLFVNTTTNVLQRDTGTSWVDIGAASPTPNLQAVCTVGNTYSSDASFNLVAIGRGSGNVISNTNVGANSGVYSGASSNNTTFGYGAAAASSSGSNNVTIGYFAGNTNTGSNSVFVGSGAGQYSRGGFNTLIGNNCDTQGSIGNYFSSNNTYIGRSIGASASSYTSYNVFIGDGCATSYQGNGINGLNTAIGALLSLSSQPTVTGAIILGNNTGIKIQNYSSGNWVLGGGADNGIHQLQCSGGIYCQTLSPSGVTWSVNTTITLGSSNYYYVYTGAGFNTITLPTASGNNNIYTFINSTSMNYTISTSGGQNIYRRNSGAIVTNFSASLYSTHQLIADGNNKFYEIF